MLFYTRDLDALEKAIAFIGNKSYSHVWVHATCLSSKRCWLLLCQRTTCSSSVLHNSQTSCLLLKTCWTGGGVWDDLPLYWELLYSNDYNMVGKYAFTYFHDWMSWCMGDHGQALLSLNAV